MAPAAGTEVWIREASNSNPEELFNLKSKRFKHFTNLTLETRTKNHRNATWRKRSGAFGTGESLGGLDPRDKLPEDRVINRSRESDAIFLFYHVARVSQAVGEISIICQNKKALRIPVKPTNMV